MYRLNSILSTYSILRNTLLILPILCTSEDNIRLSTLKVTDDQPDDGGDILLFAFGSIVLGCLSLARLVLSSSYEIR